MATSLDESFLELVAQRSPQPNLLEPTANLRQALSVTDEASYRALERVICYSELGSNSAERKLRAAELFASPIYSDACKEYFVAAHMSDKLVVLAGDRFLTEKIILGYLRNPQAQSLDLAYLTVLIGSVHLSEPILVALFNRTYERTQVGKTLAVIPDIMITPQIIRSWLAPISWLTAGDPMATIARRIRQVHPGYEGLPDEWVLKVFSGG